MYTDNASNERGRQMEEVGEVSKSLGSVFLVYSFRASEKFGGRNMEVQRVTAYYCILEAEEKLRLGEEAAAWDGKTVCV